MRLYIGQEMLLGKTVWLNSDFLLSSLEAKMKRETCIVHLIKRKRHIKKSHECYKGNENFFLN